MMSSDVLRSKPRAPIAICHSYRYNTPLSHDFARGLVRDKEKKEKEAL